MNAIDVSADVGLVAVGLVTLNLAIGLLIAVRYSPWRYWPHRRFNIFRVHNWTGFLVLGTSILHPVVLLFSRAARFRVMDVLYPVHSPSQPLENTIGAVALYVRRDRSDHIIFSRAARKTAVEIGPRHARAAWIVPMSANLRFSFPSQDERGHPMGEGHSGQSSRG